MTKARLTPIFGSCNEDHYGLDQMNAQCLDKAADAYTFAQDRSDEKRSEAVGSYDETIDGCRRSLFFGQPDWIRRGSE